MKLLFEKKDSQTVSTKLDHEGNIQDFDYIAMLKGLLDYGPLTDSEFIGDFSDGEKASIASMIQKLNACVATNHEQPDSVDILDEEKDKSESDE